MGLTEDFREGVGFWQGVEMLDRIAALIRDAPDFDNRLARVEEMYPHLSHYQKQLLVKKQILLQAPDGEQLWALFEEGLYPENKPAPEVREAGL